MPYYRPPAIPSSEITPESTYQRRREFLQQMSLAAGGWLLSGLGKNTFAADAAVDTPNTWEEITHYNNFYEYSQEKTAIAILAQNLNPQVNHHRW